MTVKEIVELLPKGHPFRLEVDNVWTILTTKDDYDADYSNIMKEYSDYNVIGLEASFGVYDYATLWLKAERKE